MKNIITLILCLTPAIGCTKIISESCEKEHTKVFQDTEHDTDDTYAHIRYGVFENIENHTVTITDIWIEGHNPAVEIPQLGTNISSTSVISSSSKEPTFDTENGEYNKIIPSGIPTNITLHINAKVICDNGLYTIPIEDAKITITASHNCWEAGKYYSYIICVDAESLELEEIWFKPRTEDYENINIS